MASFWLQVRLEVDLIGFVELKQVVVVSEVAG